MTDELEKACLLLDVDSALVIKHEYRGADYVILADYGIGGIKKYSVPIINLQYEDLASLDDYTVPELRDMAEVLEVDVPNRALKADIISAIEHADEEE